MWFWFFFGFFLIMVRKDWGLFDLLLWLEIFLIFLLVIFLCFFEEVIFILDIFGAGEIGIWKSDDLVIVIFFFFGTLFCLILFNWYVLWG